MIGAGLVRNFLGQINTIQAAVLALFSASGGAGLVGFLQSGAGAVAGTVQGKLREALTVDADFVADRTGAASCVAAFQAAMTELAARGGGRLRVRSGAYLFTVTGDADTIQIPSNVVIECEPGVTFKWGYWGSPLFAIVNKTNVRLLLNGALFQWSGAFGVTAGARDAFGYGRAIPAYEWCGHIVSAGSEYVEIDRGRCEGVTPANVQNVFVLFKGTAAGGLTKGNQVRNLRADDVCQGVVAGEQKGFVLDVHTGRYSNASNALYGMGHAVYMIAGTTTSEDGDIRVRDNADQALSAFTPGGHSVSLKKLKDTRVRVFSRRPEGAVNGVDWDNLEIDVHWRSADVNASSDGVIGMTSEPAVANVNNTIRGEIIFDAQRNMPALRMDSVTAGSKNLYCDVDLSVTRVCDGTETLNAVAWVGNSGTCRVRHLNRGSGFARGIVDARNSSDGNCFHIEARGAVPNPRVQVSSGTNNTFWCTGDATVDGDSSEFTPASGNAIIWGSARQYQSSRNLGNTTSPTATLQLPMPGAYLLQLTLASSDGNLARTALYWVVWDNASTFDFATAQLIGAQVQKGGVTGPTALNAAVDQTGLVTVTSVTGGANTWILKYGYRQLAQD